MNAVSKDLIVKIADINELEAMMAIEKAAMPSNQYLFQTKTEMFDPTQGAMLTAYIDGKPVGISHLAFLPDGSGWFEILRVLPEYQKCGAGTAMWDKALEICEEKRLRSIGMFTGVEGHVSRKIAERKGLTLISTYDEYLIAREDIPECLKGDADKWNAIMPSENPEEEACKATGFRSAEYSEIAAAVEAGKAGYDGLCDFNRTFYDYSEENLKWMCENKMVHIKDDCIVFTGARFNKNAALETAFISGDVNEALKFAAARLKAGTQPKIHIAAPAHRTDLIEKFRELGFKFRASIIILKREF